MTKRQLNKRGWFVGFLVVLVLLVILGLFRSCVVADRTALGPKDDDYKSREWVGLVESMETKSDVGGGGHLIVNVDFGGRPRPIRVAHTKVLQCGPDPSASGAEALARLTTLLPVGTAVRVVRIGERAGRLDATQGYIYTTAATPAAVATETTSPSTTSTGTSSPPKTSTGTSSPAPSTATPSSTAVATEEQQIAPEPGSVNEVLLADGYVSMDDPVIDLSAAATRSSIEQSIFDFQLGAVDRKGDRPMFDLLLAANKIAWDASVGLQAACRADDQVRLDQKALEDEVARQSFERAQASMNKTRDQIAQYEALKAGPDGQVGTDDDNPVTYDFDTDQYVIDDRSTNTGSGGSSDGGSGGFGGGFCRSWWC